MGFNALLLNFRNSNEKEIAHIWWMLSLEAAINADGPEVKQIPRILAALPTVDSPAFVERAVNVAAVLAQHVAEV
jgi:hypothetical protein